LLEGRGRLGRGEEMGQQSVGPAGGSWASRRKGLRAENQEGMERKNNSFPFSNNFPNPFLNSNFNSL